jgi:glycosyltransferase involved in cell wall biosynthesis
VRVLYLIDSLIAGGAERSLAALAPHYARLGVDLEVGYFFERDNVWIPDLEAAGARVTSLSGPGGRVARARRAREHIRKSCPDLVHTTLFEADVAGRLGALGTRMPVVSSLVNVAYGPEQLADPALRPWKVRAAQLIDATTARRVTRFHAVSQSIADVMGRRLLVKPDRIDVVPRGRDPGVLGEPGAARRAVARRRIGAGDADTVVLAIGRHEFQKGFDVLVRAFAIVTGVVPHARLLVAGRKGTATSELTVLVRELGLGERVELLGFRDDAPELLCAADVFVSASRWEGSPGAIIEAMALEVPIVATDIAATREIFESTPYGRVVPPDDPRVLADAIVATLEHPEPEVRAAARARFLADFTIERVAARMVGFYDRARASGPS